MTTQGKMRTSSFIYKCDCKNGYCDEKYGPGLRIHTEQPTILLDEHFVDALKAGTIQKRDFPDKQYACTCGKTRYWWYVGGFKKYRELFREDEPSCEQ